MRRGSIRFKVMTSSIPCLSLDLVTLHNILCAASLCFLSFTSIRFLLIPPLLFFRSRDESPFAPPSGRPRGFKLRRFPLLRSRSNSKASLDDAEVGRIPTATQLPLHPEPHACESLGLTEFLPLPPLPPYHQESTSTSRSQSQLESEERFKETKLNGKIAEILKNVHVQMMQYVQYICAV